MQNSTHFLVSILLAKWIYGYWNIANPIFEICIVALFAFLSHYPIDIVVKLTYHPKESHTDDAFWVIFHLGMTIFSIWILITFVAEFWLVIILGMIPDIVDWGIYRPILHKSAIFHPRLEKWRNTYFGWIPEWFDKKPAAITEILLSIILVYGVYAI